MAVIVSMLRGVNVGAHHRIKMDTLREVYESLSLENPQTYVQSGNIVFTTAERDLKRLAKRIGEGIEKKLGFCPGVILRTASELRDVIARNPFSARSGIEPARLLVTFLASDPGQELCDKILAIKPDPEELHFFGRELYIYFPNGMARPKLSLPAIERILKIPGTGRNWNTVTKLLELAERRG
jgi:uncharacterized protein (DUF1697 family)